MAQANDYLVAMCDGHAPTTPGKRTPYIASLGRQIRENEFNKPVVNMLEAELKRLGFRTLQTAPTDVDTGLTARTNAANAAGADIYVSVHFNAMGSTFNYSSASGFSVHIQEGSSNDSKAYKLARMAVEELAKGTRQVNRGIVKQNLAITRQTRMPAILVEGGFMDDEREALLMIDPAFQREVAQELAQAICRYFGVAYTGGNVVPASNPVKAPARDYLLEGDNGPAVSAMQAALNSAGATPKLIVDGVFGAASTSALKAFQAKHGLVVDGVYGAGSKAKMAAVLAPKPAKEATTPVATKPAEQYEKNASASKSLIEGQRWVIENGVSDGTYPDRPITRAEFWETLRRYDAQK